MAYAEIVWDLEDDPGGNARHILDGHDVTLDEVEEVLRNNSNDTVTSRSSGQNITFGWTSTEKYVAVVWEEIEADPRLAYPITAYLTPPPRSKRHGKN